MIAKQEFSNQATMRLTSIMPFRGAWIARHKQQSLFVYSICIVLDEALSLFRSISTNRHEASRQPYKVVTLKMIKEMEIKWYCEQLTKVIMCSPVIMLSQQQFISIADLNNNIFYVQISDPTRIYNNRRTVQPPSTQKSDPSMANRF